MDKELFFTENRQKFIISGKDFYSIMIKVGNIKIGVGKPKICVPITAVTLKQALEQTKYIANDLGADVDLVEFRIDYLKDAKNPEFLMDALKQVKEALNNMPLLCTFRTLKEGGEMMVSDDEYEEILLHCIQSEAIDLIDAEIFRGADVFQRIVSEAHKKNIFVIGSSHDFSNTPAKDEMVSRLMMIEREGADIAKLAVMPKDREDVLALLNACSIAQTCMDIPFIAISMGKLGMISRFSGELLGSCITFGTGTKASAPGQIAAGKLREILELL